MHTRVYAALLCLLAGACASPEPAAPERAAPEPLEFRHADMDAAIATFRSRLDRRAAQGWPPGLPREEELGTARVRIAGVENRTRQALDTHALEASVLEELVRHPAVSAVDRGEASALFVQITEATERGPGRVQVDFTVSFRLVAPDGTIVLNAVHRQRKVREGG